jgi:hypothetical protein
MTLRRMEEDDPLHVGIVVTVASGCCQAAVLVDSTAPARRRCSQCRQGCEAVRYEVTGESACCGARVSVQGRTTRYRVCSGCGQACDITAS